MAKVLIVQTTFSEKEAAIDFTKKVLQEKLAACIQLSGEVASFYWWKGAIEQDMEVVVTMKTLESIFPKLEAYIEKEHPYETPEILATTVERVGSGYLNWLKKEIVTSKK